MKQQLKSFFSGLLPIAVIGCAVMLAVLVQRTAPRQEVPQLGNSADFNTFSSPTRTSITCPGNTSTTVLEADGFRRYVLIVSGTSTDTYFALGSAATTTGKDPVLTELGSSYEINADNLYTGLITCIGSGNTSTTISVTHK